MLDFLNFDGVAVLPVFALIVIIVLLVAYLGSRYKVANVNEALIISGRQTKGETGERRLKVVRGGGTIVYPLVNRVSRLHLTARQINVGLSDAVSRQGIKVSVQGVATVKIGGDEESILNAAERFVDREDQIDAIVKNVLEGSLRSIVGTLTVEELNLDRQKFQQAVQDAAKGDLATSGLTIDNFTIQAIRDEVGYMDLIGQQETARRERDARMAKAQADQEAAVREAEANQIKINAERDVSIRRAETEQQIAAAEARAAQAGPLAQAEAQQEVTRKQTELAGLEAARKQQELVATTVRPAEAEAEAQIRRAEGEKQARIAQAQAEAERVKLAGQAEAAVQITKGEAQARVVEVNAEATAKQTTLEGNAEAGIVLSKGEAEAKALALRAEAYRQFNEAAVITTVLQHLPEIVRAAAEPMSHIDNLTVLSADGASDIVRNATRTVTEASTAVKGLTGIDVPNLLASALGVARQGPAADAPPATDDGGRGGGPRGGSGSEDGDDGGGGRGGSRPASPSTPPTAAPGSGAGQTHAPVSGGGPLATGPTAARGRTPEERFAEAGRAMHEAARTTAGALGDTAIPAGLTSPLPPHPPVSDVLATDVPTPSAARRLEQRASEREERVRHAAEERAARPVRGGSANRPPVVDTGARLEALGFGRETTMNEAVVRLAEELRVIPGIERFGGTRLADLERSGPRALRTLWQLARPTLDARYGEMTIGSLLEGYERWRGSSGPGAQA